MKYSVLFVLFACVMICGCHCTNKQDIDTGAAVISNDFADNTLRKIVDLRCEGNSVELAGLSGSQLPAHRKATIMAFASMRDTLSLVTVASKLRDPDPEVRLSALFALGQLGLPQAEDHLIQFYNSASSDEHRASALLAIGKCGGERSILFIDSLPVAHDNVSMVSAQSRALVCLASRGYYSVSTSRRACEYLLDTAIHDHARMIAAEYFNYCSVDVDKYTDDFLDAYRTARLAGFKEYLVLALGKCKNERAFSLLKSVVEDVDEDSRVVRKALMSLHNFPYDDCKDLALNLLNSSDVNTAECAADFLRIKGVAADSSLFLSLSREVSAWQPRTILLAASLKFCKDKSEVAENIKTGFNASRSVFEKVALLRSLAYDINSLDFLMTTFKVTDDNYIKSECLKVIIDMYEQTEYNSLYMGKKKNNDKYAVKFSTVLRESVHCDNLGIASMGASAIARHPEIAEVYRSTFLFSQAISKCVFPQDIEAYLVLRDVEKTVNGVDLPLDSREMSSVPDWAYIMSVSENCLVDVSTSKGDFTISLDVNSAPIAVSNFLKLVDDKYYDDTYFCFGADSRIINTGSITGFDENKTVVLPSELNCNGDVEGTVSLLATSHGDVYSSKWSISLAPSTLNIGKSSVIGTVAEGMSVVNTLNTGDKINSVKIRK